MNFQDEKLEIDNFLRRVRERKRSNVFSDPNIHYDSTRKNTHKNYVLSPMKVSGIKKTSNFDQIANYIDIENSLTINEQMRQYQKKSDFIRHKKKNTNSHADIFEKRSESLKFVFGKNQQDLLQ